MTSDFSITRYYLDGHNLVGCTLVGISGHTDGMMAEILKFDDIANTFVIKYDGNGTVTLNEKQLIEHWATIDGPDDYTHTDDDAS
tara:strand:+ start:1626 stop:1880 length:255 start_codon:yes stop_codon:yes gene_type:complete